MEALKNFKVINIHHLIAVGLLSLNGIIGSLYNIQAILAYKCKYNKFIKQNVLI